MDKKQVNDFISLPLSQRSQYVRFNPEFLEPRHEISTEEHSRLRELFPNPSGIPYSKRFAFVVSLSCASSALEGNTYTEIDTYTLLEDLAPSERNTKEETKMILNHKHAYDALVSAEDLDMDLLKTIHARLADDTGVEGSKHFLAPEHLGKIREYDSVSIGSTNYSPMVNQPGREPTIFTFAEKILATAKSITNPLEKSFYLFTRLPYLQAFRDCNKRTSRLAGNLPLMTSNEYPISFVGFNRSAYNRSMIAFYELGYTGLFKEGFIEAYIDSALQFHPLSPQVSMDILSRDRAEIRKQLVNFVIEGDESYASKALVKEGRLLAPKNYDPNYSLDL